MKSTQHWLELTIFLPSPSKTALQGQQDTGPDDLSKTLQETIAEELVTLLGRGVEIIEDPPEIKAYLLQQEAVTQLPHIHDLLQRLLPAKSLDHLSIQIRYMENKDWMEEWKKGFQPLRIGERLVVKPSWIPMNPAPGDLIIEIDPGQAFGTGTHATTQLVLKAMEELCNEMPMTKKCLLDVGTGTGILAIGAARLGFLPVLCIDNDPLAVEAAKENVQKNSVEEAVKVSNQDLSAIDGHFDVILANLDKNTLLSLAEPLVQRLALKGILILSGILTNQQAEVQACFSSKGLQLVRELLEHSPSPEWVCMVMQKTS
ncbi:MAG: 50S ribosomal protein L11 methyltransferase [Deltaproteobacteria bacterium]|nr:50S ribosomal protein L11 methyltransferase [Deltaproteobacteria bacterium]